MAIGIVATIKVQAGKEAEFEDLFRELSQAVRANEAGNRLYQAFRSKKEPSTYIVMEIYENDDAVSTHRKSDHFRTIGARLGPVLASPPDVHLLDAI